jgi:hypothetical protein
MAYASTLKIHSLIGNKTIVDYDGSDITQQTLADAVEAGDARVVLETGVSSWDDGDILFPSIRQAANFFGVDYIFPGYSDDKDQGTTMYQKALDICASIARSSTESLVIATKPYVSFPLNPKASIYRSLAPGVTDDSTLAG